MLLGDSAGAKEPVDRGDRWTPLGELPRCLLSGEGVIERAERAERADRMDRMDRADRAECMETVVTHDRAEHREALSSSPDSRSYVRAGPDSTLAYDKDNGLISADVSSCEDGGSNSFGHSCSKHRCSTACRRASSRSYRSEGFSHVLSLKMLL